jgi:hypothetical protein
METILSTIFGWAIVIAGVFLISIILQVREWWEKRKKDTSTSRKHELPQPSETRISPAQGQKPHSTPKQPELRETGISEPQVPYSSNLPPVPEFVPHPFDYRAEWWQDRSRWYRDQRGWRCEECQISLNNDRYYLHTHHIWGTQHSEPKDLRALCLGCHAEQPGQNHRGLRGTEDYKHFIKKYGRQWRAYRFE